MIPQQTIANLHTLYEDELFKYNIPFWQENALDKEFGGLFTCLNREGKLFSTDKSVRMLARAAWTYANLCNVYGMRDEWIQQSKSCLDFLEKHCIDADGRMFFSVTQDGRPVRKRRYYFCELFYINALAEYAKATGDRHAFEQAIQYYNFVMSFYRDPSKDPFKVTPKFFASTRQLHPFGTSMIMLYTTQLVREMDPENAARYTVDADYIVANLSMHYKEDLGCVLENVKMNGDAVLDLPAGRLITPGHGFEGVWFIAREAAYQNRPDYLKLSEKIFQSSMSWGWDKKYGGLFYFVDVKGMPPEAYEHDMKLWWPACEGIVAAINLHQLTKDEQYWNAFEQITDYAFNVFADHEYGEWYGYCRRDAKPTEPAVKGGLYKGFFHVARALITAEQYLGSMKK